MKAVAFLLLGLAAFLASPVMAFDFTTGTWTNDNFTTDGDITLQDGAGTIRLTANGATSGVAVYNEGTDITEFSTTFTINIPANGCAAMLIGSNVPGDWNQVAGVPGCGYAGETNILAVEFDRVQDATGESAADHIAIHYANAGEAVEADNTTLVADDTADLDGAKVVTVTYTTAGVLTVTVGTTVLPHTVALDDAIGAGDNYVGWASATGAGGRTELSAITFTTDDDGTDPVDPTEGETEDDPTTDTTENGGTPTSTTGNDPGQGSGGGFPVLPILFVVGIGGAAVFAGLFIMKQGNEETAAGKAAKKRRSQDAERVAPAGVKRQSKGKNPDSALLAAKRSSTGSKAKVLKRNSTGSKGQQKRSSQASKGTRSRGNSASRNSRSGSRGNSASRSGGRGSSVPRAGQRSSSGGKHHHSGSRSKKKKNPGKPKVPKKNYTPDDPTEAWLQAVTQGGAVKKH